MNTDSSLLDINSKRNVQLDETENSLEPVMKKKQKVEENSPTPPLSESDQAEQPQKATVSENKTPNDKPAETQEEQKSNQVEKKLEKMVIVEKKSLRSHSQTLKNLQFYLNKIQSVPNGNFVTVMLREWKGKYKLLEDHHGYVQWLFPNFFQSRFNNGSLPLVKEEADEFIASRMIAIRMKLAYDLIYDFFGIEIVDDQTGEVRRSAQYSQRYQKKEIFGPAGFDAFQADTRLLNIKVMDLSIEAAPLRSLARLRVFQDWRIYGKIDETNQTQVETLQDNCFSTWADIQRQSIYFNTNRSS